MNSPHCLRDSPLSPVGCKVVQLSTYWLFLTAHHYSDSALRRIVSRRHFAARSTESKLLLSSTDAGWCRFNAGRRGISSTWPLRPLHFRSNILTGARITVAGGGLGRRGCLSTVAWRHCASIFGFSLRCLQIRLRFYTTVKPVTHYPCWRPVNTGREPGFIDVVSRAERENRRERSTRRAS